MPGVGKVSQRSGQVRCTYCGARGGGGEGFVEADLGGLRYDYCDAACAAAHRQAVELTGGVCGWCDELAVGDSALCDEHLLGPAEPAPGEVGWRKAG